MTDEIAMGGPEAAAKRAEARALKKVQDLTAMLLRTARGAGSPRDISRLAREFVDAIEDHRKLSGFELEPARITEALAVYVQASAEVEKSPIASDSHDAYEGALAGALQVAASRLTADHLRESQGKEQMWRAFELWKKRGNWR